MLSVAVMLLALAAAGGVLWIGQSFRMLHFARQQLDDAWRELRTMLENRREMIPYMMAAIPVQLASDLDVLGNACDLAANMKDVQDSSQAETRLTAALTRLLVRLDEEAGAETLESLSQLRGQLAECEMKIGVVRDLYNRQVDVYNALQKLMAGRALVSLGLVKPAELF